MESNLELIDEERKCFEKYYSKLVKNLQIENLAESFFSEKGYQVQELINDKKNDNDKLHKPKIIKRVLKLNENIEPNISNGPKKGKYNFKAFNLEKNI